MILPFVQGSHFFYSLSAVDCNVSQQICLLLLHYMLPVGEQKKKNMVWIHMDPYGPSRQKCIFSPMLCHFSSPSTPTPQKFLQTQNPEPWTLNPEPFSKGPKP